MSTNQKLTFIRWNDRVEILSAIGGVTSEQLINDCEDNDFSLDSYITGHLMLIDDRLGETFMLNDYGVDVIDQLNETGRFIAPKSILEYSLFTK